jgi:hypothetical protein
VSWGCAKHRDRRRKGAIERLEAQAEGIQAQRRKLAQGGGLPTVDRQKADRELHDRLQGVQLQIDAAKRNVGKGTSHLAKGATA